ncbi:hypothetical protein K439DRAFT_1613475 [Ramaria rubella]|nr:hypothetical protein K439DRAFT_1613475 [Ramaria rubella]
MPADRPARRTVCSNPKYTFSDNDDDYDYNPSPRAQVNPSFNSLPTPSPSETPSARSARSSHTRKRSPSHIPRPRNAFIIFRSEFCERQKMSEKGIESDHRHISRIAAHVWNNLDEDKKAEYKQRADQEKAEHKAAYPSYRYAPVGRPRAAVIIQRKAKRDTTDDATRCRKIAELLLSGMDDEEFQKAAKELDEGIVDVELTQRTSRAAPKRSTRVSYSTSTRSSRAGFTEHIPSRVSIESEDSEETDVKPELPSSPHSGLPSPLASESPSLSDALYTISDDEDKLQSPHNATRHSLSPSPPETKIEKNDENALELAPYGSPREALPAPSDGSESQSSLHPHIRPGAIDSVTLNLFNCNPEPSTPEVLRMPCSLPDSDSQTASNYHEIGGALGDFEFTPWADSSSQTHWGGRSPSPITFTTSTWGEYESKRDSPLYQTQELAYPDDSISDVEFEKYLAIP